MRLKSNKDPQKHKHGDDGNGQLVIIDVMVDCKDFTVSLNLGRTTVFQYFPNTVQHLQ
jgi:hypothetical protein